MSTGYTCGLCQQFVHWGQKHDCLGGEDSKVYLPSGTVDEAPAGRAALSTPPAVAAPATAASTAGTGAELAEETTDAFVEVFKRHMQPATPPTTPARATGLTDCERAFVDEMHKAYDGSFGQTAGEIQRLLAIIDRLTGGAQ